MAEAVPETTLLPRAPSSQPLFQALEEEPLSPSVVKPSRGRVHSSIARLGGVASKLGLRLRLRLRLRDGGGRNPGTELSSTSTSTSGGRGSKIAPRNSSSSGFEIMLPLWRRPDFQESRPPSFFHFRRRFWHAERFLTKFCQKSVPRTLLAPLWHSFGKILDPIFDQVGSRHVPQIAQELIVSARGASQSDVFNNFLTIFAPLPFGVAFRTDSCSV